MGTSNCIIKVIRDKARSTSRVTVRTIKVYGCDELKFECAGIELPWKHNRKQVSCITAGVYVADFTWSPTFKEWLWELMGVPNRKYIRLHVANYTRELRGCIAPGMSHADIDGDGIIDVKSSRKALTAIHAITNNYSEIEFHVEWGSSEPSLA